MNQAQDVCGSSDENEEIDVETTSKENGSFANIRDDVDVESHSAFVSSVDNSKMETNSLKKSEGYEDTVIQDVHCLHSDSHGDYSRLLIRTGNQVSESQENVERCNYTEILRNENDFSQELEKSDKESSIDILSIPMVSNVNVLSLQSSNSKDETLLGNEPVRKDICEINEQLVLCSDNNMITEENETKESQLKIVGKNYSDNAVDNIKDKISKLHDIKHVNPDTVKISLINSPKSTPDLETENDFENVEYENRLKDTTSEFNKVSNQIFTAEQSSDKFKVISDIFCEKSENVQFDKRNDDSMGFSTFAVIPYETNEKPCIKMKSYVCGMFNEESFEPNNSKIGSIDEGIDSSLKNVTEIGNWSGDETESNLLKNAVSCKRIVEATEEMKANEDLKLEGYNNSQEYIDSTTINLSHNCDEVHPGTLEQNSGLNEVHKEKNELEEKPACAIEHFETSYKKIRINIKRLPENFTFEGNKSEASCSNGSEIVDEVGHCTMALIDNFEREDNETDKVPKLDAEKNLCSCIDSDILVVQSSKLRTSREESNCSNEDLLPVNLDKSDNKANVDLPFKDKLFLKVTEQNNFEMTRPINDESGFIEENFGLGQPTIPLHSILQNESMGKDNELDICPKNLELDLVNPHVEVYSIPNENDEMNNLSSLQNENLSNFETLLVKSIEKGEIGNNLCTDFTISEQLIESEKKVTESKKFEPDVSKRVQESFGTNVSDPADNNKEINQNVLKSDCHHFSELDMKKESIDSDTKAIEERPSSIAYFEKSQRKIMINLQRLPESFTYRENNVVAPSAMLTDCIEPNNESTSKMEKNTLKAKERKRGRRKCKFRFYPRKTTKRERLYTQPSIYSEFSDSTQKNSEVVTYSNNTKNVNISDSKSYLRVSDETSKLLNPTSFMEGKKSDTEQTIDEQGQGLKRIKNSSFDVNKQDKDFFIKTSVNDECTDTLNVSFASDMSTWVNESLSQVGENDISIEDNSVLKHEASIESEELNSDNEIISKVYDEESISFHEGTIAEQFTSHIEQDMVANETVPTDNYHMPMPDKICNDVIDLNVVCTVKSNDRPSSKVIIPLVNQIVDNEELSFSLDAVLDNKTDVDMNQDGLDNFQENVEIKAHDLSIKNGDRSHLHQVPIPETSDNTDLQEQKLDISDHQICINAEKNIIVDGLQMQAEKNEECLKMHGQEDDIVILPLISLDKAVPVIDLEQTDDEELPGKNDPSDSESLSMKPSNLNIDFDETDNESDNDSGTEFNDCLDISKFLVNYETDCNELSSKISDSEEDSNVKSLVECTEEQETISSGLSYLKEYKDNNLSDGELENEFTEIENKDTHLETVVSKNDSLTDSTLHSSCINALIELDKIPKRNSTSDIVTTVKDCSINDTRSMEQFISIMIETNSEISESKDISLENMQTTQEENLENSNRQNIRIESVVDDVSSVNEEEYVAMERRKDTEKISIDGLSPSKKDFFFEKAGADHQHGLFKRVIIIGDHFIKNICGRWPLESDIKPYFLSADNLSMYHFNNNVPNHHFLKDCNGKILVVAVVGMYDIFKTENIKSSNCYPKHSLCKTFGKPFGPDYPNEGPYEYAKVLLNGKVKIESKLPDVYLVYASIPNVNIYEAGKKLFSESKNNLKKCSCSFNPTRSEIRKITTESESLIETLNNLIFTNRMTQLISKRFFCFAPLAIEYYNKNWTANTDDGIILNALELENSLNLVLYGKKSDCKSLYKGRFPKLLENNLVPSIKDKFNVYIIGDSWLKAVCDKWPIESLIKPKFYIDYHMNLKRLKKLILSLTENDSSNVLIITSVCLHDLMEYKNHLGCLNHVPLSFPVPKAEMNENPISFATDMMKSIDDMETEVYKRRKNLKIAFMTCYPIIFEFYYKHLTEAHEFKTRHEIADRLVDFNQCASFNVCVKICLKRINQFIIQRNSEINSHTCDIYSLMIKLINVDKFLFPVYIRHKSPSAFLAEKVALLIKEYVSSMYTLSKTGKLYFINESYDETLCDETYKADDDDDEPEIFPHKHSNLTIELKTSDDTRQISTTTAQRVRDIKNTSSEKTSDYKGNTHSLIESKKKLDKLPYNRASMVVSQNDSLRKRIYNDDDNEVKSKRSKLKVQDNLNASSAFETTVNNDPSFRKEFFSIYSSKTSYRVYSEDRHHRHTVRSRAKRSHSRGHNKRSRSRSRPRRDSCRSRSKSRSERRAHRSRSRSGRRGYRSRSRSKRRSHRSTSRSSRRVHRSRSNSERRGSRSRSRSEGRDRHSRSRSRRYRRSRSKSGKHYRSRSKSDGKGRSRSGSGCVRSRSKSRGKKNKSKNKERSSISKDRDHLSKDASRKSSKRDKCSKAEEVALKNLWEIHNRECNLYRSNPSVHPDYNRLKRMWVDVMISQGSNPYSQTLHADWESYWPNKLESIFNENWEEKKTECLKLLPKLSVSQSSDSSSNSESSSYSSSKRKNKHKRKHHKTKKSKHSSKSHKRESSVDIIEDSPDSKGGICNSIDPDSVTSLARDLKDAKQLSIEDLEAKISQFVMKSQRPQKETPINDSLGTFSSLQIKLLDVSTILSKLSDRFGALGMSVKVLHEKISHAIKVKENALNLIDDDAKMLFALIKDKLNRIIDDKTLTLVQRAIIQEALDRLTPFLIEIEEEKTDIPFYGLDLNVIANVTEGKDIVEVVDFINNALAYKRIYDVSQDELMKIYLAIKDIQIKALRHSQLTANLPSTSQSKQHFLCEKKFSGSSHNMAASKPVSLSQPFSSMRFAPSHSSNSLHYIEPCRGKTQTSEKASKIKDKFMTLPMNEKIRKFSDFHNLPFEEKNFLWSHLDELEKSDEKLAESLRWMISKNRPE